MTRRLILAAVLSLGLVTTAEAGFDEGVAAYNRGDYETAFREMKPWAEQGFAPAQYNLGLMYGKGQGVPQDYAQAAKWFREAAEQGHASAQFSLGVVYANGPQDYVEAVKWWRLAAEQGHAKAQYNLGVMSGLAAEQGLAHAQYDLGVMYEKGQGVSQDYAEAVRWWRLAAEQGFARAQHNLGVMYADGQGVPQNYAEAVRWWRLAAEQGLAPAQYNLGLKYADGQGVPQDYAHAAKWWRPAAEQGHAEAQYNLGVMSDNGLGVAKNYFEAARWYGKAAEQGLAEAQASLGALYIIGQGVPQDYVQGHMWSVLAAAQGHAPARSYIDVPAKRMTPEQIAKAQRLAREWKPKHSEAQYNLGSMYLEGQGVLEDYAEAAKWYRKAAKQGDAHAQYNLGLMYEKGQGVRQDDAQAAKWFREAAEQGHLLAQKSPAARVRILLARMAVHRAFADREGEAQLNLAAVLGLGLVPPAEAGFDEGVAAYDRGDYETAFREIKPLAERGNAAAQHFLGSMYLEGKGVPQDYAQAAKWFREAAEQVLAEAQFNLAAAAAFTLFERAKKGNYREGYYSFYLEGDYEAALRVFRPLAEQGNDEAQGTLGSMHLKGEGVPVDYAEAMKWFRKAAEQNNAFAQRSLGSMYLKGQGVPQDYIQGHMWLNLAAAQGGEIARIDREALAERMTDEQILEAQRLAREWQPNVPPKPDLPVVFLQFLLKERDYDPGPVDGFMGERTRSAMTSFKADMASAPSISHYDRMILEHIGSLEKPTDEQ
jgi:TPR repeat protein